MDLKSEIEEFITNGSTDKLETITLQFINQKKEVSSLDSSLISEFSSKVVECAGDPEVNFDLFIKCLASLIEVDPYLFKESIYKLITDIMVREKSVSCMNDYETFLKTVIKIFSKDFTQFVKKLLDAINSKLANFSLPKKRKRKMKQDVNEESKKLLLTDGSIVSRPSQISNIWPQSIVELFDDIVTRLNVSQVISLWNVLNQNLLNVLDEIKTSISENELFKIDFIALFLCQIFTCCRIHEHLVYKKAEISSAILDFNQVQHKFYEVIFNSEHNNRIMSAFLRISYDYENFLMLYFYHYDPEANSELNSVFLTDKSRIKSSEWKIFLQRIRNFGKSEEKNFSNLLHVQQIIKSKIFHSEIEIEEDFLSNILTDQEQMDFLMSQKDARSIVLSLLNDHQHFKQFIEYLCHHDTNNIAAILSFLTEPKTIDTMIGEILKCDSNEKSIKLLKIIPLLTSSNDNKKLIFKLILDSASDDSFQDSIVVISLKLLKNDGYKNLLNDFQLSKIVKKLKVEKYQVIYETIFKQNLKRINGDMLKAFEWVISNGEEKLFEIFSMTFAETNFRNISISKENFTEFKIKIIEKLSSMLTEKELTKNENKLFIFSKICLQNIDVISEGIKEQHMKLLNTFIKNSGASTSEHSTELFKMVLRDSKKLNLNDEKKGRIVNVLMKHLNELIEKKVKIEEISDRTDIERELITLLSNIKTNCRLKCSQFLQNLTVNELSTSQLIYCFKVFQILFEHSEKQKNQDLIKNFMKFTDNTILNGRKITDTHLLCTILNAQNEMIKTNKQHVDNKVMDKIFMFLLDTDNRPLSENIDEFCKFYEVVGQFLYLVGNFQFAYFKARTPQYFKVFQRVLQDIYFYQRESDLELSEKELLMLQRLTLQLENVLKMLMKHHGNTFNVIIPYIVAPIVNVYMKNPKLLTLSDKFKLSIKNICLHLLTSLDERARKHIFAVVDEPTRDLYTEFLNELKLKK